MMKNLLKFILAMSTLGTMSILFPQKAVAGIQLPKLTEFQSLCYDVQAVGQIMQLYQVVVVGQATPGAPQSGLSAAAAHMADTIPKLCTLVMAVATAKDAEGILRASKLANNILDLQLDNAINLYEDTTSLYNFASRLKSSNASTKEKLLNVGNHRRFLNFATKWVFPVIAEQADLELRNSVVKQQINSLRNRAQRKSVLEDKLYGCRKEIKKKKDGVIELNGEEIRLAQAPSLLDGYDEAFTGRNFSRAKAGEFRRVILDMITQTTYDVEEFNSATLVLDEIFKKSYWVSVHYTLPNSKATTDPVDHVVVQKTGNSKTITDATNIYYVSQYGPEGRLCESMEKTQHSVWVLSNPEVINDPFVKGSWIAEKTFLCPVDGNAYGRALDSFVEVTSSEQRKTQIDTANAKQEKLCLIDDSTKLLKELRTLQNIGGPEVGALRTLRDTGAACKPESYNNDLRFYKPIKSISTVQEWVDHYNSSFDLFIQANYTMAIQENSFSDSFRKLSRGFASLAGNKGGGFNPNSGNLQSAQQSRFIGDWRKVSRCDSPRFLLSLYQDEHSVAAINSPQDKKEQFALIVRKCRQEEGSSASKSDIFRYMFDGMMEELKNAAEAEEEIVKFEFKTGFYKASNPKQAACEEALQPADIASISAEMASITHDSIEDINKFNQMLLAREIEREVKAQSEAERLSHRWHGVRLEIRQNQQSNSLGENTLENADPDARGRMFPDLGTVRQREDTLMAPEFLTK